MCLGACPHGVQRHVLQQAAVFEHRHQGVLPFPFDPAVVPGERQRGRRVLAGHAVAQQGQAALLRALAGIGDRVLADLAPGAVHPHRRALHGEALGIAVELLQQGTPHAEDDVVRRIARGLQRGQDRLDRRGVDAVALDHAHMVEHAVALAVDGGPERRIERAHRLQHDAARIARIGAHHQRGAGIDHRLPQLAAPQAQRGEQVVRIGHHRDDRARLAELAQHVAVGVGLARPAPRGDGAVLGGRHREGGHLRVVVQIGCRHAQHGVRPHEADQVRRPADGRRLRARHAARAEVVHLERQLAGVVAGLLQVAAHQLTQVPALRRHRDRIPHAQQHRLEIRREPEHLGVVALDRHQHIVVGHHAALRHRADAHRQVAVVALDDVAPAGFVERLAVRGEEPARRVDHGRRDGAAQVFLRQHL